MNKELALKLYNVMCATEALEKDLTVGKPGTNNAYKAVGEKTVLNMIKPLFKTQRLIILPVDGDISENLLEYTDGYGKNKLRAITQLKVCFDIIDADTGESTRIVGFGNGADSQDKGSGKAFTYALKTALQKAFLMFSGEDTDNTHSDEITQQTQQTQQEPPKVTPTQIIEIGKQKGYVGEDLYKKIGVKKEDDIKYLKQDRKVELYNKLGALPDK